MTGLREPRVPANSLGRCFAAPHTPFLFHPYHDVWMMYSIPDFAVLPMTNGVVKWPANKAHPIKSVFNPTSQVRLGATLPPLTYKYWVGDGGAEFSAQYYLAENYATAATQRENCLMHVWEKPMEYNLPSGTTTFEPVRLGDQGLEQYMLPGSLCSYNHVERMTRAFGVSGAIGAPANGANVMWNDIVMERQNVAPALVYSGPKRIALESADLQDYTLLALSNKATGAFAGMALLPSKALLQPSPAEDRTAYSQYLRPPPLATPAAMANDSSPEMPTNRVGVDYYGSFAKPTKRSTTSGVKAFNRWQKVKGQPKAIEMKPANANLYRDMPRMPYRQQLGVQGGVVTDQTTRPVATVPSTTFGRQAAAEALKAAKKKKLEEDLLLKQAISRAKDELKLLVEEDVKRQKRPLSVDQVPPGGVSLNTLQPVVDNSAAATGEFPAKVRTYRDVVSTRPIRVPPDVKPNDGRAMEHQTAVALDQRGIEPSLEGQGQEVRDEDIHDISAYTNPLN
jgi:hypothetical protein